MSLLSGVEDQLRRPLRAFLFPQRVYLQLEDQAITAMALQGGSVTWLERVLLPPACAVAANRAAWMPWPI